MTTASVPLTWERTIAAPTVSTKPSDPTAGCLLQIYPLDLNRRLVELTQDGLIVGRDQASDMVVNDQSVSRRHARIERHENGYTVVDLGSTNGTHVNDIRVEKASLASGDCVQFGSFIYKFLSSNSIELQYHETVYSMMTRDALTGTFNKRYFIDVIGREFSKAEHRGLPLTLILLDIDHFKSVNDTHGHLAGDEVLRELGKRVGEVVAQHDVFARYGGEEFAILLAGVGYEEGVAVAERCRAAVAAEPFSTAVGGLPITISLGVAEFRSLARPEKPEQLIALADEKLYEAKKSGRNRVC
ncbi:MAG: diguanylate cyclase [Pirellula sp.]|nr:diguanylate cyclase [Pirellula sp.]